MAQLAASQNSDHVHGRVCT